MNRTENETGVSEIVGAIILMSIVAMAVGVVGVGLLSQPLPQKIPAISVDITTICNTVCTVYMRHEGGDPLSKGVFNITLDGVDKTDSFKLLDGPASGSSWTSGENLYYVVPSGQSVPASVQIIYNSGSSSASLGIYTPKIIIAPYAQRANAGGPLYTDTIGNVWSADQAYSSGGWGYVGGSPYSTSNSISGTSDPVLYQTERYGNFEYQFTVPNGNYVATLKFAEIYHAASGLRIFNVNIEGTPVMSNTDLFALAGANTAYDRTFPVTVNDGVLNIAFQTITNNAKVSAIQVVNA